MTKLQDLVGVLKGVQNVMQAGLKLQEKDIRIIWQNSSLKSLNEEITNQLKSKKYTETDLNTAISETSKRLYTVIAGLKEYSNINNRSFENKNLDSKSYETSTPSVHEETLIKLTPSDKELLRKLDMEHCEKMEKIAKEVGDAKNETKTEEKKEMENNKSTEKTAKIKTSKNPKAKQSLSSNAKQRTVPSSRIGRMVSFGSLAAGLGLGTVAEYARRTVGLSESNASNLFLTQSNMDRIVDTLCKVRGAALKLGQILSIQDESMVNPELAKALERVRKSADFMPDWQVEQVMKADLGDDWRLKFADFQIKPFAAASIGQVHSGSTHDGREVAIKIQYPGVAQGIESDIDNLLGIMKVWKLFPDGMFIDNFAAVAKRELAWEVDYEREAECTRNFKKLLEPYPEYYVPHVIDDLSAKRVFTSELIDGITIDQCTQLNQSERDFISSKIMELCLREIMEFRYMQTDPNWANFFYNRNTKTIILLDFGATRDYSKAFVDIYIKIIKAAMDDDRDGVLHYSKQLGFLTGYESKIMEEAHVDTVMILGEVFKAKDKFDFSKQGMTQKLQELVPTMLAHRLCPPPEEIYSLHRKLSGVFLLCSKLKSQINARDIFLRVHEKYQF